MSTVLKVGDSVTIDGKQGEIVGIWEDTASVRIDGRLVCCRIDMLEVEHEQV